MLGDFPTELRYKCVVFSYYRVPGGRFIKFPPNMERFHARIKKGERKRFKPSPKTVRFRARIKKAKANMRKQRKEREEKVAAKRIRPTSPERKRLVVKSQKVDVGMIFGWFLNMCSFFFLFLSFFFFLSFSFFFFLFLLRSSFVK